MKTKAQVCFDAWKRMEIVFGEMAASLYLDALPSLVRLEVTKMILDEIRDDIGARIASMEEKPLFWS